MTKSKSSNKYDTRLEFSDPLAVLKLAKFRLGKRVGANQLVECPFHETSDMTPSCSVEVTKGVFRCHGCNQTGTLSQLIAQKFIGTTDPAAVEKMKVHFKEYIREVTTKVLDPEMVEAFRAKLDEAPEAVVTLERKKGLTRETLERFNIGWNGDNRYTLPVYDLQGNVVNVRYRTLDPAEAERKCINHEGHGTARLYPIEQVYENDEIIVTEGELKALGLIQMGFPAVSGTGGAGKWYDDWNYHFKGKRVVVLFDVDKVGRGSAEKVARGLLGIARAVKVAQLPLDIEKHPHGDVNDWMLEGGNAEALRDLLQRTPLYKYEPLVATSDVTAMPITRLENMHEVTQPARHNTHIEFDAVIAAEEFEPFRIPVKWQVVCRKDQKCCTRCPINSIEDSMVGFTPHYRLEVMRLVDITEDRRDQELRKVSEIPKTCEEHQILVKETANVQILELVPDLAESGTRTLTLPAFLIQKENKNSDKELHGSLHTIRGFPTSDPKSGRVVVLAYEANPSKSSIDLFRVTPEIDKRLEKFQPAGPTLADLGTKIAGIYADLSAHVTHVVGRDDLHIAYDLAYHSVIGFQLAGRDVKGWVEALVVGDTGQGKSVAATALRDYYGLGDIAVGGNCTAAGLLGAVMESLRRKRWVYHLGKMPLNDGRLLFIEELSGLTTELFRKLRDARSSGRHEDTKAKLTRVMTRTRLIGITNPKGGKQLSEYQQGVVALAHLFEEMADVRRFDLAYFAAHGEVDPASIRNGVSAVPQVYDRESCQNLVMWAWSRKPSDVRFDAGTREALRTQAAYLSKKYSRKIPLVIDTEQDEKLARLAAAIAARTYSTDDGGETLLVQPQHVEFVSAYLDRIYSSRGCLYDKYSERMAAEEGVADNEEVIGAVRGVYNARSVAEHIVESDAFSSRDVAHIADVDYGTAEKFVGILLKNRAVRPAMYSRDAYRKTQGLTILLRRLLESNEFSDHSPEEKHSDKGY